MADRTLKTKTIYTKNIRPGEKISESFLVTEKNLAFSQKGSPYLNLRLKDKTGEMEGKIWENATELDKQFKRGDIVHVQSRAVSFKNTVQLSINDIKKMEDSEVNPADYFPVAGRDIEEIFKEMMSYVEEMNTPCLKSLLEEFFKDDSTAILFKKAPAAKSFHHVYIGGLLEHTLSVVRLLETVADHYPGVDRDILITGGLLHDIGKIYEFSYDRIIDYSDQGRLVGHIVIGIEMLNAKIAAIKDFPDALAMELRHLILSHHGSQEFGSPKRPKTLEALIVHHIDDLDAKVNAFQGFIEESRDEESSWTPFHRLLDRFIYKG
ncbi:MAG: HD domain-containing protein [Deltaproteobacteria bacterium]|nr:HD domain-containing protein [Deltaproteobacteria bacterium]